MTSHAGKIGLERRRFLVLVGIGVAAASCSPSPDDSPPATPSADSRAPRAGASPVLVAAWKRSRARGVPLVVLVTDDGAPERSGEAWGAYLDLCSERARAELALCEVVFAASADVHAAWTSVRATEEPAAIVFGSGTEPAALVPSPHVDVQFLDAYDAERPALQEWISAMETNLSPAIARDDAAFVRAASLELGRAVTTRAGCQAELAELWRRRIRLTAPAGAKWIFLGGCGETIPEDRLPDPEEGMFACGMGSTDRHTRRFLQHFAFEKR